MFNASYTRSGDVVDEEAEALKWTLNSAMINLQGELLNQPQSPFWVSMNHAFRQQETRIRDQFQQEGDAAREQFAPEQLAPQVEVAAAQQLYAQLQSQPALLNSSRAAHLTTDEAGVALALKSDGLAPADLILAPAMLSFSTLLTESPLGRYMDTITRANATTTRTHRPHTHSSGIVCRTQRTCGNIEPGSIVQPTAGTRIVSRHGH